MSERQTFVKDSLLPHLQTTRNFQKIDKNHACFELPEVKNIVQKYDVIDPAMNRWKNFQQLLCGYEDLPIIVLQNPSNDHTKDFGEMIQCRTIKWISDILEDIGLKLEDVPIIDICSFFSMDDINNLGKQKWAAVEESYKATEAIIRFLDPIAVISCQCATKGQYWKRNHGRLERVVRWKEAENGLARSLASDERDMEASRVKIVPLGSQVMWMVNGIHPMRIVYELEQLKDESPSAGGLERSLKLVFQDVYRPCVSWVSERKKQQTLHRKEVTRTQEIARVKDTNDLKATIIVEVEEVPEEEELAQGIGRLAIK